MPRGRPKKVVEEPIAQPVKKAVDRKYKTPQELREKMQEYFDSCHTDYDWRQLLSEFVELNSVMEEHPTWSNHEKKFREIIMKALTSDVFPDEAGLRIFLGLTHEGYKSYKDDPEYEAVFNWSQDLRESWAARRLAAEPRAAAAYLNILKQASNGGWVDRKTDQNDRTLTIKAAGVGGVEAFK